MTTVSQTALAVGTLRAAHRMLDAEPWVIDDTVSVALFGERVRTMLREEPRRFEDARVSALRGHVLARSAFAEGRLRTAALRGVRQCVLLGAGFDTFAYRRPAWAQEMRIFEVDAPTTQAEKRLRLKGARIDEPANVVYAAIDFERTSLSEGLRVCGFDAASPAFVSWLGVMMYLSGEAVEAVFRFVAALPAGSEIAFTFAQPHGDKALERRVSEAGEPFRTLVHASELAPMLRGFELGNVACLTIDQTQALLGPRRDALRVPMRRSLAVASR